MKTLLRRLNMNQYNISGSLSRRLEMNQCDAFDNDSFWTEENSFSFFVGYSDNSCSFEITVGYF